MRRTFSNFRINKDVNREGVNSLMKNLHKRTKIKSVVVFTSVDKFNSTSQQNWSIEKISPKKYIYTCLDKKDDELKQAILNTLSDCDILVAVIICDMNQKLDKNKYIKEMWGFKVTNNGKKTTLEEITSEEIYNFSTTNMNTGKSMPPAKEIVYCGPDGKICGWDMV